MNVRFWPLMTRATLASMTRRHLPRSAVISALLFALAGCATQASAPGHQPSTPTAPATRDPGTPALPAPVLSQPMAEARAAFVRETAAQYGIDPAYIESVLAKAQIRDSIIAAMSKPAEA